MALKWGIISSGKIAHDFCIAVSTLNKDEHELVAVAARCLDSSKKFATLHKIDKAYGSYEELVKDSNVDIVYIGAINPYHFDLAKLALDNGKPVLVEKPLCINVKQTKELIEYAQSKNLFLMEGVWSRFFPAYKKLKEEIDQGTIGEILQVLVTFGHGADTLKKRQDGGGTTINLGIYCCQFAALVFWDEKPQKIISAGHLNSDGVDTSTSSTLIYSHGRTATLVTHAKVAMPCEAIAVGTKGTLKLEYPFWCPTKLQTPNEAFEFPLPEVDQPMNFWNSQGLAYECEEVKRCLRNGLKESPSFSHDASIQLAQVTESIRKQVGVLYPQDDE